MASAGALRLSAASVCALGMRESNQDAIGAARQDGLRCFVIADGAGGHAGGEIASKLVVDAVLDKFNGESAFGKRALLSYVEHAVAEVARVKQSSARLQEMSATVAALLVDCSNARAVWAHLGDTRLYLFRGQRVHAMTKDHSLTQQLIDAGYARQDQLRVHPQRNILFAAVGAEGETAVAVSDEVIELEDGDAFLACTDGLWEWVDEADMERTLAAAPDSEHWLAAMCRLADAAVDVAGKSRDNYSVYAITVHRQDSPT